MPDLLDKAQELEELERSRSLERALAAPGLAIGEPGTCEECGGDSDRLVAGFCAPCREELARRRKLRAQRLP